MKAHVTVRWTVLVAVAVALLAIGAAGAYVGIRATAVDRRAAGGQTTQQLPTAEAARAQTPAAEMPADTAARTPHDVVVTLGKDAIERAGIATAEVATGTSGGGLHAPGIVAPDAYKQVAVTPLVGGRVTSVVAELGQHVQRGQTIARVLSPELAEARARYVSVRAELVAHERELARVERLVQIGAASRQELERVHAAHTARRAELESASARLRLFGVSAASIDDASAATTAGAVVDVPAPIAGVVTARAANPGMNVDATTVLFTIVDLSTVWVMVDVYERDFTRLRVGAAATITAAAYPAREWRGRVDYVDPQLSAETRTAKVRIAVPNVEPELRFGMFVEARVDAEQQASMPMIPRRAVQTVGERTVVYLVDPARPGTFIEREVRLGAAAGESVPVVSGLRAGDVIVTDGSFSVRASVR